MTPGHFAPFSIFPVLLFNRHFFYRTPLKFLRTFCLNWWISNIVKMFIYNKPKTCLWDHLCLKTILFLTFTKTKELSLWNKIKFLNHKIIRTRCCKPLIFQTQIIWSNRIHSLKYLKYATFGSKDNMIRKSEFGAKAQFLNNQKSKSRNFFDSAWNVIISFWTHTGNFQKINYNW